MTKYIYIGYTYEEIAVIDPQQYNTKKNKQYNKTKKITPKDRTDNTDSEKMEVPTNRKHDNNSGNNTYEEIADIDPQQYNTKKNKQYNKT